jgi:hypothetical protein
VAIAIIEERMILVNVTAPTTKDITTDIVGKVKSSFKTAVVTAMICIHRHPVRTVHHYFNAVYDKVKATALFDNVTAF